MRKTFIVDEQTHRAEGAHRGVGRHSSLAEHRAAISEVLRVIASSPGNLQPIFNTVLESATRLCRADIGTAAGGRCLRIPAVCRSIGCLATR
jgi:hypothetical protein